ncbi:putative ABC transport system permease protein [Pedobacter terrae]|uniref:Putative ABC transport system permease protein n=1 Tax=Pedobacter terrae TaxID=405671 RepID=A0A1G7V1H4_9SPHI|nr:FtsX-like permease family protein [Pedobacter terrae]SDG52790.1 putative ABC transport system permease protein [Pedobacter terrae]
MFRLNLKIALRNLWRNRGITSINVGGLAIALAAFILVILYFTYETSFDKTNPNYNNIYVVGRIEPDFKTNYTSPPFAKAIKQHLPEVENAGITKRGFFEFSMKNGKNTLFAKNFMQADYNAAKILDLKPTGGLEKPPGNVERLSYLSKENMRALFPDKTDNKPEIVGMGASNSGITSKINGSITNNLHSNITFDGISIGNEIGKGENYGYNNYTTYIQVKPGTDVANLEQKITDLYRKELLKGETDQKTIAEIKGVSTFLDPLANLHLRPKAGNDAPYKILIALSILGILILVIACINFTNLSIAQATKRAKEVGIKKVMGAYRFQLTAQFLVEIFIQCFVATILGLTLAELSLPYFNNLFQVNLSIWTTENDLCWQLPLILCVITLIAGTYPALVLSGFKPALVLKGNFSTSKQSSWLRNGLLVFQFSIAVIFIIGLFIINSQLKYMRSEDLGFTANQVVYIKNISMFNKPETFAPVRDKILKIPGIKSATVATDIPDGAEGGANGYTFEGVKSSLDFIDVDFDYFETLDIKLKEGRFFSKSFPADTTNGAVVNESTVAKYGMKNPVGKTIRGCNIDYKIVGVVKDFKAQGFESAVKPTIYSIKNPCGNYKTQIMVKIEGNKMSSALAALKAQWLQINPKDGEDFRYEFLDDLYGKLFKKQEQLQSVFFGAALLTIFIAVLGLFAFAKYITNGRIKEIAVRKILGASDIQIFSLINSSFFIMVLIANVISWPLAYVITKRWLETFAYRIDLPILPFISSALITILLTVITVSIQARKAVKANPVDALKYE